MQRMVGRLFLGMAAGVGLLGVVRVMLGAAMVGAGMLGLVSGVARAAEPLPWQMYLQPPATPIEERIHSLHDLLMWIIVLIVLFVMALLAYVCVKFSAKRNPIPSKTSHNTVIEIAWTVVPVLILLVIAIPSFKLMYFSERVPDSQLTLKVTGLQWYWHYQYPDNGDFQFDSYGIDEKNLAPGQKRLLDVDNQVVLPVNTNIRVQIAGQDVMHSWFIPSFGVQKYAVVGRLNETWLNIEKPGIYYGECNQICGVNHSFMPIVIKAVTKPEFDAWVAEAKTKFAATSAPAATRLAAASSN